MSDRYPEGLENFQVDYRNWRANILLDTSNAFDEDKFAEMRIGSILMRTVGPCVRCSAVECNYDAHERMPDNEPNLTLNTFRKAPKLGALFGMYYQMELLDDAKTF